MDVTEQNPDEVRQTLGSCAKDSVIELKLRRPAGDRARVRRSGAGVAPLQVPPEDESSPKHLLPSPNPPADFRHRRSYTVSNSVDKPIPMVSSHSVEFGELPQYRRLTQHIPLQNLINGTELSDRLHNQSTKVKDTGCHPAYCVGSHLWPKETRTRPYAQPRTREEVWPLAEDFIRQYYESKMTALGEGWEEVMRLRLGTIKKEIEVKGHYDLTYEELVFGARTAWRNAPRCINRIIWRQLEVLDARNVVTTQEMFDAICHHIKYGTNGGNMRSTITVFQHRTRPNADYRVWNTQLIRYAGYRMEDGSILGDPANAEFTEVCVKLGWTPPPQKTQFDILPVVLQAAGGEPQWYEIPRELVLEVPITHPDYPDMDDLNLKWYALPAVSCLCLDIGGIEFPAIPFNGWYMGTEIGRDLADCNRYNLLKPIALKLGLNLNTKLWKDKALTELNVAVIHSYQKCNVSIVDHHSATESFMTHMKNETLTRGGCPGDWVWLVPPLSGSICPVFHQEMLLYHLSPSYEYQDEPWKHHIFPTTGRVRERYKFKTVAEMVRQTARMFHHVYQKRIKATILYATETGRSRNYASIVKDCFERNFASNVHCMENYNRASLEHEQLLIVVTSTFGSGDPPANGEAFGRYLLDLRNGAIKPGGTLLQPHRKQRMSTIVPPSLELLEGKIGQTNRPLTQVKYAVFGLGSRAYPNFCTFAHTCDNLLKDLGAEQICSCGEGDELCGQEESFQFWLRQCYQRACEVYKLDPRLDKSDDSSFAPAYSKDNYRIQSMERSSVTKNICEDLKTVHGRTICAPIIKSRTKLQAPNSDRSTILVCLDIKGHHITYEPGDHVGVYPQNGAKLVSELLERLALPLDPDLPMYLESRREITPGGEKWVKEKRLPIPVTLREAFTYYLDITTPPSPQFLKLLAKHATRVSDQTELEELAKGGDVYEDWKYERFPSLFDVLNQFHSLKVDVTLLLHHLPLLQCRYYSISSAPSMYPNELHMTVAIVSFKKRNGQGPRHNGVCSNWLNKLEIGSIVPCFIRRAPTFHLPDDPKVPIIMVGPGTGIAPFRSFWQDRMFRRNEALKNQLALSSPAPVAVVSKPLEKPEDKRRRKTAFIPPKIIELLNTNNDEEAETSLPPPTPMRRSVSDTADNHTLAQMIAEKEKAWGAMELYFGCRTLDTDHIYKDEMSKARISGALTEVHVALSREPGYPKTYVQHLLKKNAESIVRMLIEERGHFYVCGDISMAAEVCRNLQNIFEDNAAMSADEARRLIESMKDNGFYHEDIFGVTLKTAEVTTRVRTAAKRAWRILVSSADNPPQTPVTPYPNRQPSLEQYSLDTMARPNQLSLMKRPTVTVLMTPGGGTPSSPLTSPDRRASTRPSAPEFSGGGGGGGALGGGTKRKTFMQPLVPSPTLETSRVQLLDPLNESEVEMFLHPPDEEGEVKYTPRGVMGRHPAISEEEPVYTQKVESAKEVSDKGGSPIKKVPPPSEGQIMITVDDSSGIPISRESVLIKEEGITPAKVETESKEGAVLRREGASERRQLRRIRTNSQVETII
eukprot:Em0015g78a